MNRKEAKEIMKGHELKDCWCHPIGPSDARCGKACGYLEADNQWREKVRPLLEALENTLCVVPKEWPVYLWTKEALEKFEKENKDA